MDAAPGASGRDARSGSAVWRQRARPEDRQAPWTSAPQGAFTRGADGKYRVDFPKMEAAMNALARDILVMQGNGDYEAVGQFQEQHGKIGPQLQADLDRLGSKGIPVDIVFEQGTSVLGL